MELTKHIMAKKSLSKRQRATLKRHSAHHTKKHMKAMRHAMKSGKSFSSAHKIAMRRVGK